MTNQTLLLLGTERKAVYVLNVLMVYLLKKLSCMLRSRGITWDLVQKKLFPFEGDLKISISSSARLEACSSSARLEACP